MAKSIQLDFTIDSKVSLSSTYTYLKKKNHSKQKKSKQFTKWNLLTQLHDDKRQTNVKGAEFCWKKVRVSLIFATCSAQSALNEIGNLTYSSVHIS